MRFLFLLSFCFLISFPQIVLADANSSALERVLVVRLKGDVTSEGRKLEVGDALKIGAKIVATGRRSYVQFQFSSGSLLMLRDGELVINKIKSSRIVLDLVKGTIFSFVKKKDGNKFKVRTRNAALGIRGTKFFVMATPDDTYLCVCDGTVNIKNKKGNIDVAATEDIRVSIDGDLKKASASEQMWGLTVEGFSEMGFDITPEKL